MTLTAAAAAFMAGCRVGLRYRDPAILANLVARLEGFEATEVPFAVEGAGMALDLLDQKHPPANRMHRLLDMVPGSWHPFVEIGVGCSRSKSGQPVPTGPMVQDGFGFHQGLFGPGPGTQCGDRPAMVARGLGRALWFSTGGELESCVNVLRSVDAVANRWEGMAFACGFAGDPHRCRGQMLDAAGHHAPHVEHGFAIAAKLHRDLETDQRRSGNGVCGDNLSGDAPVYPVAVQ